MTQSSFKTIGFIGLGQMGSRMVSHLKGEAALLLCDVDAARTAELAADLGGKAVLVADMADADAVVLMLPNSQIVDQLLRGNNGGKGLFDVLKPGAMVIDMSSSAPTNSIANAAIAAERGLKFIDAPVSGGIRGAEAASLAIMVGGADADYQCALPTLKKMGSNVFSVGKIGAGHAVKALNNLMSAASLAVSSEVFAVGSKFGLDPALMLKVVNASSGQNWVTTVLWQPSVVERGFNFGFTMQLMEKDVRVAMSLFDAMGSDAQISRTIAATWAKALKDAPPGADMTVMALQAEKAIGL